MMMDPIAAVWSEIEQQSDPMFTSSWIGVLSFSPHHRDVDDVIRDVLLLLQLEEENATAAANFIDVVAHEIIRRHIR